MLFGTDRQWQAAVRCPEADGNRLVDVAVDPQHCHLVGSGARGSFINHNLPALQQLSGPSLLITKGTPLQSFAVYVDAFG